VDLGLDIIAPGAFAKTIAENPTLPVLWAHNTREVIGVSESLEEDTKGLHVKGRLVLDVQRAQEVHSLMKADAVKGMSIGYDPIVVDWSREKENIRILREVKLWEYSLVPFPMNPEAQVTAVKTAEDLEEYLRQILAFKGESIAADKLDLVERTIEKLSALRAAGSALGAAKQQTIAPTDVHAMFDRFSYLTK
jgi:HK97 family phage prohead protease